MTRRMTGIWFLFAVLLLPTGVLAETGITLQLDRTATTLAEPVRMAVHVSGSRSSDAPPVLPGLDDFLVTKGGTSSQVEIINGQVNTGLTYTYFIQPKKTGTFTIGPATIVLDGRRLESNRATLVVQASSTSSGDGKAPVFLEATTSARNIFVGQQVLYVLKLYHRVNIDNLSLDLPKADHLQFTQLTQPQVYQTNMDGVAYQVLEVRYALLVSREGSTVLGPSRLRMTVRRAGRRSMLDEFFNDPFSKGPRASLSSSRPLTVATEPIDLVVRALPEEGKTADFSGLVGSFQLESRLEPRKIKTGESATLTVQIRGKGNVQQIPDIHLPDIPFVRTYGDQPVLENEQDQFGMGGQKTMKWALVPEKVGQVGIPTLRLSYFDPETGKYSVLQTTPHTLSVSPGTPTGSPEDNPLPTGSPPTNGTLKKEIEQVGKDILPIHTNAGKIGAPSGSLGGWLFWAILVGPPGIYLMLLISLKLRERSPEHIARARSKNAFGLLKKRCRRDQVGCAEGIDLFRDYLNDRFQLFLGALTSAEAEKVLLEQGVTKETAKRLRLLLQQLENVVYTGNSHSTSDAVDGLLEIGLLLEKEAR